MALSDFVADLLLSGSSFLAADWPELLTNGRLVFTH